MSDQDGLLVGWGVGTATFPAIMFQAQAKAVLRQDGSGVMEIGAHDMGPVSYTHLDVYKRQLEYRGDEGQ